MKDIQYFINDAKKIAWLTKLSALHDIHISDDIVTDLSADVMYPCYDEFPYNDISSVVILLSDYLISK